MMKQLDGKVEAMSIDERIFMLEKEIEEWTRKMKKKYGMDLLVVSDEYRRYDNPISLKKIIEAANISLWKYTSEEEFPKGIATRRRLREVSLHRQMYLYMARMVGGYSIEMIAGKIGYDHASTVHANKIIPELLKQRDFDAVRIYISIRNEIKKEYGYVGDVQPYPKEQVNS